MIPVLAIMGLLALVAVSNKSKEPPPRTGATPAAPSPALLALQQYYRRGMLPPPQLVEHAMRDAWTAGNMQLVQSIYRAYGMEVARLKALAAAVRPPTPPPSPPQVPATESAAVGAATVYKSPLKGIGDDEWGFFVDKLKIDSVDSDHDSYVGAFSHNKRRLTELGFAPESLKGNSDKQYEALVKDLSDHWTARKAMLQTYVGTTIEVDGKPHVVTASGVLGLLKSAGSKNAARWLTNSDEHARAQKTTEMFIRANGCF